ncbi:MAG: glycosyltransferase, partial [Methanosphaera sp.]|nr:glycosyltransferase [Methanosphaera sp.]
SDLNLENNVFFKGFYEDQRDLYKTLKSSSLFVLPSLREGFGIVVIEANACGVPVVTVNAPMNASKDLVVHQNGWVINDNCENLAKIINQCISEGIPHQMRNKCREFAKKYDWNHITSLTENYYYDIVNKT